MKKQLFYSCVFLFVVLLSTPSKSQIISTIAGSTAGFSGDGGLAVAARLNSPWGVARDAAGNIYVADFSNNRVRKIDPAGIITTFAGTGGGYGGDGGPAIAAGISGPTGVAVFGTDVYIAEVFSSRIRKVNAAGIITTYAGNGTGGFSGDGGPAILASISNPNGVGVDNLGNVYIPDQATNRVRKVNTAGIITTVAGSGVAGYSGDGGPAIMARLNLPNDVAVDAAGNIYIAEFNNNIIRKVNTSGIISTYVGTGVFGFSGDGGPCGLAQLYGPGGIDIDAAGNLFISDADNYRIRKVNSSGIITSIAGNGTAGFSGDGGPALLAQLNRPNNVCYDPAGNVYIADIGNHRVRMITPTNVAPSFTGGLSQSIVLCENAPAFSINTQLAVSDPDIGQTITWSLFLAPLHGAAAVSFTTTSTGATLTPTGLTYTPATGYSGADSFKVVVSDGMGTDTITIYVTINPLPNAGTISGPSVVCIGATITLTSTMPGGTWSASNGNATVSSGGVVTGVLVGVDTIMYTVTNGCGTAVATKVVTVSAAAPDAGVISGPAGVCAGAAITLSVTGTGGVWSSGSPAIAAITGVSGVSGVSAGTAVISYTVSNSCGTDVATYTVTVHALPAIGAINGLSPLCIGATATYTNSAAGGLWTSSNTSVAVIGSVSGMVTAIAAGTATITYTVGPNANGCVSTATFPLVVHTAAAFTINGSIGPVKCNGDTNGSITISVAGGTGPYQYSWLHGGTSPSLSGLAPGAYTVQVTETGSNCTGTKDFVISSPSFIDITATVKNDACDKGAGAINIDVTGGELPYIYKWSFNSSTPDAVGLAAGTYTVTVTDKNLCSKQYTATVGQEICLDITIHDVITPNGDGLNDVWIIEGLSSFPGNTVQLFDKWGDIVLDVQRYENDFSGKGRGSELPDGTYFYLVKLNSANAPDGKSVYTGSLLIKR